MGKEYEIENEATRRFTRMLWEQILEVEGVTQELHGGGAESYVYESGNAGPGETGWCFDVTFKGRSFNVEVYGPFIEGEA